MAILIGQLILKKDENIPRFLVWDIFGNPTLEKSDRGVCPSIVGVGPDPFRSIHFSHGTPSVLSMPGWVAR